MCPRHNWQNRNYKYQYRNNQYSYEKSQSEILGDIGESEVIDELKKLPKEYYVHNDYNYTFKKAFRWKKYDQWVKSVQIDHLILSPYGIFIIETKNYSQDTFDEQMKSEYSPVFQVKRSSAAIWVIIRQKSNVKIKTISIITLTHNLKSKMHLNVSIVHVDKLCEEILRKSNQEIYSPVDLNRIKRILQISDQFY